jgi:hypothetical protein
MSLGERDNLLRNYPRDKEEQSVIPHFSQGHRQSNCLDLYGSRPSLPYRIPIARLAAAQAALGRKAASTA